MTGEHFTYWNDSQETIEMRTPAGFAFKIPANTVGTSYKDAQGYYNAHLTLPGTRKFAGNPEVLRVPSGTSLHPKIPRYTSTGFDTSQIKVDRSDMTAMNEIRGGSKYDPDLYDPDMEPPSSNS